MSSILVFGPTGQIASVAALTAAEQGGKVWLAMRDTSKTVPGVSKDAESSGQFSRVQADLTKPDTVKQAVETSGAKRAFAYLAHGSPDHGKAAFEAMKAGGIEFVVFVSSFTIYVNEGLRDTPESKYIPYVHAQAEAHLNDIFGEENYVAMRCGAFASNMLEHKKGIASGQLHMWGGPFEQDNIVPDDMGRVAGNILVSGPKNGQHKVYLYGPKILSREDSAREIAKVLGKDVKITHKSAEEAYKDSIDAGLPEAIAKYMIEVLQDAGPDKGDGSRFPKYEEGVKNVELYTGRPATTFDDWVRENKAEFS